MKKLKEAILKANKILIYGAGHVGDLTYAYICMLKQDDKIVSYAVTNPVGVKIRRHGLDINSISYSKEKWPDATVIVAVHEDSSDVLKKNADNLGFAHIVCVKSKELLDRLYENLYEIPIKKNKILFMNYYGCGYGCNPKYIAEQFIRNGADYEMVWGVDENCHYFPDSIRTVKVGTLDYYREVATAGIWIDNVRKAADVKKREGQFYVQTWHGAAPFKKVEGDLIGKAPELTIKFGMRDSQMADLFISGSRFYRDLYRNAFWYDGEILESGLPRQDIFWHKDKAKETVFSKFSLNPKELAVLYAPTFRDDGNVDYYDIDIKSIKTAIKKRFGKECSVLVGKHPINRNVVYRFDKKDYIDISMHEDFEEILAAVDILITDYSGCIYDFSFSDKPAFLYQPDHEVVKQTRDFYIDPSEMPYPVAYNMSQFVDNIIRFNEDEYIKKLHRFMEKFGNYDDGRAAQKVCDRITEVCFDLKVD